MKVWRCGVHVPVEVRRSRACGGAAFTCLWRCGVQFAFKRGNKMLLLSPRGLVGGGGLLSLLNNNTEVCACACVCVLPGPGVLLGNWSRDVICSGGKLPAEVCKVRARAGTRASESGTTRK